MLYFVVHRTVSFIYYFIQLFIWFKKNTYSIQLLMLFLNCFWKFYALLSKVIGLVDAVGVAYCTNTLTDLKLLMSLTVLFYYSWQNVVSQLCL